MSPSQEVLKSIENRLKELEEEIAALQSARSELQTTHKSPRPRRTPARPHKPRLGPSSRAVLTAPQLTDEEWVERRAAELAAQSRAAAA